MPDHDHPDRPRTRAILEALEESGPATVAELAAALDTHPMTIERRCRPLQRAGHIRLSMGGVYALVEADEDRRTATILADVSTDQPTPPNPAD